MGETGGGAIADTTIIHLVVTNTSGASPVLQVVDVVTSEWDPSVPQEEKPADPQRWRSKAAYLHNLVVAQRFISRGENIELRSVTIILVGTPRGGKTTIFTRMIKDPSYVVSHIELPSTGLAGEAIRVVIEAPDASSAKLETSKVVAHDFEESTDYLAKHTFQAASRLQTRDLPEPPKGDTPHSPQATPLAASSAPQATNETTPIPSVTTDQPPTQSQTGASSEAKDLSDSVDPSLSFLTPNDILGKAAERLKEEDLSHLEDCTFIHILDTGGQPELLEVLPPFLTGSTINVLIFRLIDKLEERYKVQYVSPEGERVEYESSYTLEEVVFQVLSSFSHRAPPPPALQSSQYPSVSTQSATILVGTHKDLVSDEVVESLDCALQEKLRHSSLPENTIIHYPNPDEKKVPPFKLVVPVDNTSKTDPGISLVQELIDDTIRKQITPVQIPHAWMMFEHSLRSTGRKILTFRKCVFIGSKCGLESEEEVKVALWYLSQQFGNLRYHPDVKGMEGIVIIDFQVIVSSTTGLINTRYVPRKACTHVDIRFCKTGRCPKESAEELLQCKDGLPPAQLLLLLEYHRLLTPVKDKNGIVTEYFVPTILRSFPVESLHRPSSTCGMPDPLLFCFSCGFSPLGLFKCVIVYLSSPNVYSELEWQLSEGELFRNMVTFHVGDDYDKVTLIARPTMFEVQIEREDDEDPEVPLSQVCAHVRSTIDDGISAVKASMSALLTVQHQMAFYCRRKDCHPTPHPATPKKIGAKKAQCSSTGRPSGLSPEQTMWYGSSSRPAAITVGREAHAILQRRPKNHELHYLEYEGGSGRVVVRVTEELSPCWEKLADCLRFRSGVVGGVKLDNPHSCEAACRSILILWLQGDPDTRQPVTWATLIQAIREVGSKFDSFADRLTCALLHSSMG